MKEAFIVSKNNFTIKEFNNVEFTKSYIPTGEYDDEGDDVCISEYNKCVHECKLSNGNKFTEFAVNLPIEKFSKIELNVAGQVVDIVYRDSIPFLYDIYNIPKNNENGYNIIPFYFSNKILPSAIYSVFKLKFYFETCQSVDYSIQVKTCTEISSKELLKINYFQNYKYTSEDTIRFPVSYIMSREDLIIDNKIFNLEKTINDVHLYKVADDMNDIETYLDLTDVKINGIVIRYQRLIRNENMIGLAYTR